MIWFSKNKYDILLRRDCFTLVHNTSTTHYLFQLCWIFETFLLCMIMGAWFYKKQCNFFSTRALISTWFLKFSNNFYIKIPFKVGFTGEQNNSFPGWTETTSNSKISSCCIFMSVINAKDEMAKLNNSH